MLHSYAVVSGSSQSGLYCMVCLVGNGSLAYLGHLVNMTGFKLRSHYPKINVHNQSD